MHKFFVEKGDSGGPILAVRNNTNDGRQYQIGVHGGNQCLPSRINSLKYNFFYFLLERENAFEKIDGKWVEQLTGVKCKSYNEYSTT